MSMNDDEKRLLLACAACLLAERTGAVNPDTDSQIRVLREFLKPFQDWMQADMRGGWPPARRT